MADESTTASSSLTALLLVDVQVAFDDIAFWGKRNNHSAEDNCGELLACWRSAGNPVYHIGHHSVHAESPLYRGKPGTGFMPQVKPVEGETVLEKSVNSAFIGTGLEALLRERGVTNVVVAGFTTPHCISTTCRMASNLGFVTTLAHDASAAFTSCEQTGWNPSAKGDAAGSAADAADLGRAEQIHNTAINQIHGEFVTALSTQDIITSVVSGGALPSDLSSGGRDEHPPGAVVLVEGAGLGVVNGYYQLTYTSEEGRPQFVKLCNDERGGGDAGDGEDGDGEGSNAASGSSAGGATTMSEIVYEDEEYDGWYFVLPGGRLAYNQDCDALTPPSAGWECVDNGKAPGPTVTMLDGV